MDSISDLKRGATKDIIILMEEKSQFHFMVQAIQSPPKTLKTLGRKAG
jgi:hypothetical protein